MYKVTKNLNDIMYAIDTEGGFVFKFLMMIGLSITLMVCSIVLLGLSPFSAYKKNKRQKRKGI